MEIGNECIDSLEFETWVNEDMGFAFGFASFCPEFERTRDGGANADYTMAGCLSGLDSLDSFGWNMKPLGMHMMIFDIVAADWKESAKADMKGKILNLNAFVGEFLH